MTLDQVTALLKNPYLLVMGTGLNSGDCFICETKASWTVIFTKPVTFTVGTRTNLDKGEGFTLYTDDEIVSITKAKFKLLEGLGWEELH